MNENTDEILIDLLIKKATYGLTEAEQVQLDKLENGRHDDSFDLTVSAIALIDQKADEPMPSYLRANIRASAERYFDERDAKENSSTVRTAASTDRVKPAFWNWLGWAVAAAACLALVANIYYTRTHPEIIIGSGPGPTPTIDERSTVAQERERFMESGVEMIKAPVTNGPMKDMPEISGDVVWSDAKQEGYLRLRGLPMNDKAKQQYQLWIFDKTQSNKTPISGGVFDVSDTGEVIVPIKAMLKAQNPTMFAVTVEKPGGVMVTKGDTIAALGKVET